MDEANAIITASAGATGPAFHRRWCVPGRPARQDACAEANLQTYVHSFKRLGWTLDSKLALFTFFTLFLRIFIDDEAQVTLLAPWLA